MNINILGAKNSVLPIIAATCLKKGIYFIKNCPNINDVFDMINILKLLNVNTKFNKNTLIINTNDILIPDNLIFDNNIRSSYYFYSVLSHYKKKILHPLPSGCNIGDRKIDMHIDFFNKHNITSKYLKYNILIDSSNFDDTISVNYYFKKKSVGATINAILLSVIGNGKTILKNCCINPYIFDLISFLNKMNFKIDIDSYNNIIYINKTSYNIINNKIIHSIIPDPITTGSYIISHVILSNKILILKNTNINLLGYFNNIIKKIGINIIQKDNSIIIDKKRDFNYFKIETGVFPKLYTDLMPIFCVLGSLIGNCEIKENIMNNRFIFIKELDKLGFKYILKNNKILILSDSHHEMLELNKPNFFKFNLTDLRGGFAILISIIYLIKFKNTIVEINNFNYIKRGYPNIEDFLLNYNIYFQYQTENSILLSSKPINLHSALGL